jgi:hypothetical protein
MHLMSHVLMLILLIGAIRWMFFRSCRRAAVGPLPEPQRPGGLGDEVTRLKDRIATLERIAVDERGSSAKLAAEIESLRD